MGRKCECSAENLSFSGDLEAGCRPDNTTSTLCNNRGDCICGKCECYPRDNRDERVYGEHINKLCSGPLVRVPAAAIQERDPADQDEEQKVPAVLRSPGSWSPAAGGPGGADRGHDDDDQHGLLRPPEAGPDVPDSAYSSHPSPQVLSGRRISVS